ncbi:MAG: hypothetical protein WBW41_17440 [Verrucomicrobiia bacterium]
MPQFNASSGGLLRWGLMLADFDDAFARVKQLVADLKFARPTQRLFSQEGDVSCA